MVPKSVHYIAHYNPYQGKRFQTKFGGSVKSKNAQEPLNMGNALLKSKDLLIRHVTRILSRRSFKGAGICASNPGGTPLSVLCASGCCLPQHKVISSHFGQVFSLSALKSVAFLAAMMSSVFIYVTEDSFLRDMWYQKCLCGRMCTYMTHICIYIDIHV